MKKDFIRINDIDYRAEINMNTAENWENLSGKKLGQFEIESAQSVNTGGVATRAMLLWLFCAIVEGEELEDRAFELDFLEFKRMLKPGVMSTFAPIFIKQYIGVSNIPENPKPEEVKKKSPILSLFRNLGRWLLANWVSILLILVSVAVAIFGTLYVV